MNMASQDPDRASAGIISLANDPRAFSVLYINKKTREEQITAPFQLGLFKI